MSLPMPYIQDMKETEEPKQIEVKGISKAFKGENLFENLSFIADTTKPTFIIGESGSGKTTLLNILAGITKADKGTVMLKNRVISKRFPFNSKYPGLMGIEYNPKDEEVSYKSGHIGYAPCSDILLNSLTVKENLLLNLKKYDVPRYKREEKGETHRMKKKEYVKECIENIKDYLEQCGMANKLDSYPNELSSGEYKRLLLINAVCDFNRNYDFKKDVFIFDEPTANLDSKNTEIIIDLIKKIADNKNLAERVKKVIIIATHDTRLLDAFEQKNVVNLNDFKG